MLVLVGILAMACTSPSAVASVPAGSAGQASDMAAATASASASPTVTVGDDACASSVDERLPAAVIRITVANETSAEAAVGMYRIPEDHDFAELAAVVEEEQRRAEAGEPLLGHPPYLSEGTFRLIGSGQSDELALQLNAGTYGIFCLRTQAGALRPFQVLGPITVH